MRLLPCVSSLTLIFALGATAAPAQSPVQFGIGGGVAVPIGDLDANKVGWQGMALIRFRPGSSPLGLQIDGNYQRLTFKEGFFGGDGRTRIIHGTANLVFTFPTSEQSRFTPYLIGGAGIYNVNRDASNSNDFDFETTKFGLNGGVGFDIGAGSGVAVFVEGRFHNIFDGTLDDIGGTSNASVIPITVGLKFGGN
jgi:opacity protein-like surface antigen